MENPIRKILEEKKMTQKQFAEEVGVTQQAVSEWIRDINAPSYPTILRIEELFNADVASYYFQELKKGKKTLNMELKEFKDIHDYSELREIAHSILNTAININNYDYSTRVVVEQILLVGICYVKYKQMKWPLEEGLRKRAEEVIQNRNNKGFNKVGELITNIPKEEFTGEDYDDKWAYHVDRRSEESVSNWDNVPDILYNDFLDDINRQFNNNSEFELSTVIDLYSTKLGSNYRSKVGYDGFEMVFCQYAVNHDTEPTDEDDKKDQFLINFMEEWYKLDRIFPKNTANPMYQQVIIALYEVIEYLMRLTGYYEE